MHANTFFTKAIQEELEEEPFPQLERSGLEVKLCAKFKRRKEKYLQDTGQAPEM